MPPQGRLGNRQYAANRTVIRASKGGQGWNKVSNRRRWTSRWVSHTDHIHALFTGLYRDWKAEMGFTCLVGLIPLLQLAQLG